MPEIGGKAVEFADHLPARQWWELYQHIAGIKQGDRLLDKLGWETSVALCQSIVASWEFDGDPQDAVTYEALDFTDMLTLVQEAYNHAASLIVRGAERQGVDLGE